VKAAIGYRHVWREALLSDDTLVRPDALEIMADHFFARPELLDALACRYPLVLHDVGCSVATGGPDSQRLHRLQELVRRARPVGFTDHLAVTRTSLSAGRGIDLGHLCPVWYTEQTLQTVADGVRRLQDALEIPVALENIASPFEIPGATLSEGEFWHRLVDRTGCGLLLDVTNALLDGRNRDVDPALRLAALPLPAVRWAHLAGGRASGAWWIDSHSEPVEEASYALLRRLSGQMALEMVIVERDSHLPPLNEIVGEARRAVGTLGEP
jgi:uncharacterized protein